MAPPSNRVAPIRELQGIPDSSLPSTSRTNLDSSDFPSLSHPARPSSTRHLPLHHCCGPQPGLLQAYSQHNSQRGHPKAYILQLSLNVNSPSCWCTPPTHLLLFSPFCITFQPLWPPFSSWNTTRELSYFRTPEHGPSENQALFHQPLCPRTRPGPDGLLIRQLRLRDASSHHPPFHPAPCFQVIMHNYLSVYLCVCLPPQLESQLPGKRSEGSIIW